VVEKRHYPQERVIEEVMSDTTLRDLVLKRLDADTKPEDEWSAPVERQAIVNGPGTRSTIARASGLGEVPS